MTLCKWRRLSSNACHNSDSPTFESFDYAQRKKDIAHPIPEDVKGHYLELEKQRKKEQKAKGDS